MSDGPHDSRDARIAALEAQRDALQVELDEARGERDQFRRELDLLRVGNRGSAETMADLVIGSRIANEQRDAAEASRDALAEALRGIRAEAEWILWPKEAARAYRKITERLNSVSHLLASLPDTHPDGEGE